MVDDIAVLERDLAAMEGRLFPGRPPTPYQHAWLQVGDTLMRLGASVSLRNRWIRAMREFTVYAIEEGKIRRGVVADNRSMDEAIDMRRYTIGLKPTLIYLEACCGAELPDSVLDSAKYLELCYHILAVQGLQNDLASMAKDFEEGHIDTNMVLRFRQRSGASLQKSCETIMAIHDASVRQFDLAAEALVEEAGAAFRARLSTYLDHIRYMQTGFGFFHMHAHRYTQIMAVERNLAHRIDLICH